MRILIWGAAGILLEQWEADEEERARVCNRGSRPATLLEANAISQVGNTITAVAVKRTDHASVIDPFTRTLP